MTYLCQVEYLLEDPGEYKDEVVVVGVVEAAVVKQQDEGEEEVEPTLERGAAERVDGVVDVGEEVVGEFAVVGYTVVYLFIVVEDILREEEKKIAYY